MPLLYKSAIPEVFRDSCNFAHFFVTPCQLPGPVLHGLVPPASPVTLIISRWPRESVSIQNNNNKTKQKADCGLTKTRHIQAIKWKTNQDWTLECLLLFFTKQTITKKKCQQNFPASRDPGMLPQTLEQPLQFQQPLGLYIFSCFYFSKNIFY